MTIIKSFSVSNGDMFYIEHSSSNFTIIDCHLTNKDENKDSILEEIRYKASQKDIVRFISTHPDEDHIHGIEELFDKVSIPNFYCVKNDATKPDETTSFEKYCELRDSKKTFYIKKNSTRKWMNRGDDKIGSSGINILWPDEDNDKYKEELQKANEGKSFNNISPIIKYFLEDGVKALWMGDIETNFLESIAGNVSFSEIDILFAPHHGRNSGKVPLSILEKLKPKVIIIGEAPSSDINYIKDYNTIKQNSAKDIVFECSGDKIHIHVGNEEYRELFLVNLGMEDIDENHTYIGSIEL